TEWIIYRQGKFAAKIKYIFLAIDVPKDNEQSPKAVEHLMTNLAGGHMPLSKWEEWWDGAFQLCFSLEIVSIDGYIQFIIRTPEHWRDMVEAAVYAQYPEAEIMEVDDYTKDIPDKFPNTEYNFWASELALVKNEAFPIRSYVEFEHSLTQELKDPMAALLEIYSRIGMGEQMWFQIIVKPTDDKWKDAAQKVVSKLIGEKVAVKENILDKIISFFSSIFQDIINSLAGVEFSPPVVKKDDAVNKLLFMSPGARKTLELVEYKMSKLGFYCKIRVAYVGKLAVFNKATRVSNFFSAIKQYNALNANALKPSKFTTKALYFFVKRRVINKQNKLMQAYKSRSIWQGMSSYILNIEELATLYHFPASIIKVPLLKKTESKKAEPPSQLPFSGVENENQVDHYMVSNEVVEPEAIAETDQQFLPDSLQNYQFDNKYFENKFAKQNDQSIINEKEASPDHLPPNLPIVK
ncbi:MAG: hypothetical protein COX77_01435, partial [Candidatus Komeilibacteria bacterium CG_4_10_14_0_2_um_filter_37_10]